MDVQAADRRAISAARPPNAGEAVRGTRREPDPPLSAVSPEPAPEPAADRARLERLERWIEERVEERTRPRVSISLDERTREPIVRVIERETGKLIREIPPEELRRLADRLDELRGILIDRKA